MAYLGRHVRRSRSPPANTSSPCSGLTRRLLRSGFRALSEAFAPPQSGPSTLFRGNTNAPVKSLYFGYGNASRWALSRYLRGQYQLHRLQRTLLAPMLRRWSNHAPLPAIVRACRQAVMLRSHSVLGSDRRVHPISGHAKELEQHLRVRLCRKWWDNRLTLSQRNLHAAWTTSLTQRLQMNAGNWPALVGS